MAGRLVRSSLSPGFAFIRSLHKRATHKPPKQAEPYETIDPEQVAKAKSSEYLELFKSWMSKNKKSYNCEKEMVYRFGNFTQTLKEIEESKKLNLGYQVGLNYFADYTLAEWCQGEVEIEENSDGTDDLI